MWTVMGVFSTTDTGSTELVVCGFSTAKFATVLHWVERFVNS